MDEIIYKKYENLEYIQFKRLIDLGIKHAYTLRGENIDFARKSEKAKSSYSILCKALKIEDAKLFTSNQNHTNFVKCIKNENEDINCQEIDGFITNLNNVAIATINADCILFLIYDPVKKVIASVHSGWKGTLKRILENALNKMINEYNCNSGDIICAICPSIRKCHFEVDEDVMLLFKNEFKGFKDCIFESDKDLKKYFIDTVQINKVIMKEYGIKDENILDSNLCSVCNEKIIPSYRAHGESSKRSTAIICI